jgi:hypothetical protein
MEGKLVREGKEEEEGASSFGRKRERKREKKMIRLRVLC